MGILLYNAQIVNRGKKFTGYVEIRGDKIAEVAEGNPTELLITQYGDGAKDLKGKLLLPGVIDDQVHFREPGLTDKADIAHESAAAIAGGVTSFMDMPNTIPPTVDLKTLDAKYELAKENSFANYGFFIGATNNNYDELTRVDYSKTPGIKIFLGSSTGNMLVNNEAALNKIFSLPYLIAIHSEDEKTIKHNSEIIKERFKGAEVPIEFHPVIRSDEACFKSTYTAVSRARKYNTRLHILHLSTAKELDLLNNLPLKSKKITAEACTHHLWFTDADYERLGAKIKCNPAIKTQQDRNALIRGLKEGKIDIIATDHAPHLLSDKVGGCFTAASGIPLVQHSLVLMLELVRKGDLTIEEVVKFMCHNPAELYSIKNRGYIDPGMYADLTIVDADYKWTVSKDNLLYKCGWSPFEGTEFHSKVTATYVNGVLVFENDSIVNKSAHGMRLEFDVKY